MRRNFLLDAITDKNRNCTGCSACYNACSVDALQMMPDELGFLHPDIAEEKCVHCDLCIQSCPVLTKIEETHTKQPVCYAVQGQDDLRKKSSSAGVFTLLSEIVLKQGGIVVGAMMDEKCIVHHAIISSHEELEKLRKSKYVQSEIGLAYQQIACLLKENKYVLFSGTPCQVAALRTFLGKEYCNLLTIDILCHGVPSQKMLNDFLKETKNQDAVSVDFRAAQFGWKKNPKNMLIYKKNGERTPVLYAENEYEQGFHNELILRESCYDCEFAEMPRQGDISLGDFWGIGDHESELDDDIGTGVVLINSKKGERLFEKISDSLKVEKEVPLDWLRDNRIHKEIKGSPYRKYFNFLYKNGKFIQSVKDALNYKFSIGIVGPWMNINCGGALTYFALYSTLTDMGYSPIMISQPEGLEWSPATEYCRYKELPYPDYAIAPVKKGYAEQREFNNSCDTFIVGSDQLFTGEMMRILDGYSDLEWVNENKKKIAYAASFARENFDGTYLQHEKLQFFLKRFDAFSVREKSGVELAKNEFQIQAEWVLDPVFLCAMEHWDKLIKNGMERVSDQSYVFGYILDPNQEKECVIKYAAKALNAEYYAASDVWNTPETIAQMWSVPTLDKIGNEELLAQIKNSKYVVTDSFHGVCFAIIFHKPFTVLVNKERGASRFYSILSLLGLENRILNMSEEINDKELLAPIDYESVELKLETEKERCISWLKNAIESVVPKKKITDYEMACNYCDRSQRIIEKEQKWNNDCLNGRIDWLIGHVDEKDLCLLDTDQKQWEQLEDHRKRMDGFDATVNDFKALEGNLELTNQKQWEQIEDHRKRMDGLDAVVNNFRVTEENLELTNQKQWEQLEDHRMRLDGLEAQISDETRQYRGDIQKLIQEQQEYLNRMNELEILVKTIQNSYSFKLGRMLTYLPRKVVTLLKKI